MQFRSFYRVVIGSYPDFLFVLRYSFSFATSIVPSGCCRYSVGIFDHRTVQRLYLCVTTNLISVRDTVCDVTLHVDVTVITSAFTRREFFQHLQGKILLYFVEVYHFHF